MSITLGSFSFTNGRDSALGRTGAVLRRAWHAVAQAHRAAVSRRLLSELDDRSLADLGISRGQANFEASRAPWDLRAIRR